MAPPTHRIAKLLARAGVASRREIERMIAERRVALNGAPVETPATLLASLDGVTVDGQPVAAAEPARLFLYHKPIGLLVTERDPKGRPTIYDRLPRHLPRVVPVGRLDLNTEGLLLLTTDGGLKRQLELPATGVPRTYRARAYGPVTQAQLEALIDGITIEGVRYGAIDANLERRTGANVWIELTLAEGKNREVRRVLEHLGLRVGRLIRTRYGPFVLGDLPAGAVGEVRRADLDAFRETLGRGKTSFERAIAVPAEPTQTSPVRGGKQTVRSGRASKTSEPAEKPGHRAPNPQRSKVRSAPPPTPRHPREGGDPDTPTSRPKRPAASIDSRLRGNDERGERPRKPANPDRKSGMATLDPRASRVTPTPRSTIRHPRVGGDPDTPASRSKRPAASTESRLRGDGESGPTKPTKPKRKPGRAKPKPRARPARPRR